MADLWGKASATGTNPWRKWERKYGLTSEYAAKSGYAWLIGKATRASYERPSLQTHVVLRGERGTRATMLPRYQPFTNRAIALARQGGDFVEIAGNRGDILVSVVAPRGAVPDRRARVLYRQSILTRPQKERKALVVRVEELRPFLRSTPPHTTVEHVYDFFRANRVDLQTAEEDNDGSWAGFGLSDYVKIFIKRPFYKKLRVNV